MISRFLLLMAAASWLSGCEMYRYRGQLHQGGVAVLDGPAGGSPRYYDADPAPVGAPVVVQQVIYVNTVDPAAPTVPPLAASRRDRVPDEDDEAPPFDAAKARTALSSVDLSACRAAGAPRGYGHATATFNPAGNISKVVLDSPSNLPAGAVQCIGNALGTATVPVFRGSLVTVGTSRFVP
jgi:hypothetical protein